MFTGLSMLDSMGSTAHPTKAMRKARTMIDDAIFFILSSPPVITEN
jgi:hypothetical protein